MHKLFSLVIVLSLISCGKKEWSKESLSKQCNSDFKKRNEVEKYFNESQLKELCDCVADKMFTRYKSKSEADEDTAGAKQIGSECATQVMSR